MPPLSPRDGYYEWEGYGEGRTEIFTLGENEAKAVGDILLGPWCDICDVPRIASAPVLDGDLSEWSSFPSSRLDRERAATIGGAPPEHGDLSGTLQWAWDAAGLYLAVHVTDDALVHDSADLAQDDVFELAIDGDGDNAGGGPGDHLYRVTHDGRQSDYGATSYALTVATRTLPAGWDIEIFIPAGQLKPGALMPGRPIHFNWALGDDDDGGAGDTRLIASGTRLDPPERAWPWATLGAGTYDFVGLVESGHWEWAAGGTLNDVFFVDNTYGWAVGPDVWRTTDGGSTWRRVGVLTGQAVQRVIFADRLRGWAQDTGGGIFRSEDGGETWVRPTRNTADQPTLTAAGRDDVWAAGSYCYASPG